jgi:protein SCO1
MFVLERSRLAALLALLATIAFAFAACGGGGDDDEVPSIELGGETPAAAGFRGATINPPMPKPDFTLTDTSGEDFDLIEDTEGYVTLLYLGYTHCPDICPTHMLDIAYTLDAMDPADVEDIKVVFVTTDPERDTPEVMRKWLDLFNEDFIGLTADQATIDQLQIAMGIQPARGAVTDRSGPGGYEVSHAAYVLAFGRNNVANLAYPFGMERDIWLNDIPLLVREGFGDPGTTTTATAP